MDQCNEAHPKHPTVRCVTPAGSNHPEHDAPGAAGLWLSWPNEAYIAVVTTDARTTRQRIGGMARSVPRAERTEPIDQAIAEATLSRSPIVRHDDPASAHLAAERIQPKRGTRKAAVIRFLQAANGEWVDGYAIASPDVGGSEGLRRLRELRRDDGWPIEERPHPTSATSWQYRLLVEAEVGLRNFD